MSWLEQFVAASSQVIPERAREALWARGVTDEQITLYSIGHVAGVLPEGDYPKRFVEWCAIGDRLDDVFVLPLTNALGEVRGVQFRHVDRSRAGYMNFIEVNDEAIFFGLAQAVPHWWSGQTAFLVEGSFDLFPIQRVFPGTVATLTARVTDPLLHLLRRLVTRVWLGYDMDGAGRGACERYQKQLCGDFDARIVRYPQVPILGTDKLTKDPGELWETWGDVKFQEFVRTLLGVNKESSDAQDLRQR